MSFKCKAKIIKCPYQKEEFRIFNCSPVGKPPQEITLSSYFTFSIKGQLAYLDVGKEYTFELEVISESAQFGTTCKVISVPSLTALDLDSLTPNKSKEILSEITTTSQADNILKVYPDFIKKVMTEGKEGIDVKKIYNVGAYRLNAYIRLLTNKYKYLNMLTKLKDYQVDIIDCKSLYDTYHNDNDILEAFDKTPYRVLINCLHKGFNRADSLLMKVRPELEASEQRCEFIVLDILDRNENDGSSKLAAKTLFEVAKTDYNVPQLLPLLKNVSQESDLIYYNEDTNELSKMNTYSGECLIADFVKEKVQNPIVDNFEWEKFKEIKDGTLTDEQSNVLKMLCENNIVFLDSPAGCVDCDTEYFNGLGWKKISNYDKSDKVLQYNKNGDAELVYPNKYIKNKCNTLYHFETKYGTNQTLSLNHRMIFDYEYSHNHKHDFRDMTMEKFKDLQENTKNGNHNLKFITTFNYNGQGIDLTDNEIKIMCAVICDGAFYYYQDDKDKVSHRNSYKTCRFHIKKERKKNELRRLFKEGDIKYKEIQSAKEGYTDFYITAPRREKEFTPYWYSCSQHQLQIICDNILKWDGSISITKNNVERKTFSTVIKQTADFIQFAFSSCGYRTTIYINDRVGREKINKENGKIYKDKSIEYDLSITERKLVGVATKGVVNNNFTKIEKVNTVDGYEYCFNVSSGMLVLRRNNRIFITGNCGKTSTMMAVIHMLENYNKSYACLTATGKASARFTEQTGRPCSTIHRATMNRSLDTDYLIIDEDSFLSIELMCMIINAITNKNMKLLFVGDSQQLPSLSCGRIVKDCLESNIVPSCTLTKCFRFSQGGMAMVSSKVREGEFYLTEEECQKDHIILGENKDYEYIQSNGTMEQVCNVYMSLINKGIKKEDICVVIPQNVGDMGTFLTNNAIQQLVNPPIPNEKVITNKVYSSNKGYDMSFKVGDLVMNTKNNYHMMNEEEYESMKNDSCLCKDDVATCSIFNGQIGKILDISEDNIIKILFDQEIIVFDRKDSYNLLLSYSSNIFKLQGSQCKYIIVLTLNCHNRMLNRQLLYTALTRASKGIIEIGDITAMKYAVATMGDDNRKTWLKDLLVEKD